MEEATEKDLFSFLEGYQQSTAWPQDAGLEEPETDLARQDGGLVFSEVGSGTLHPPHGVSLYQSSLVGEQGSSPDQLYTLLSVP